jgi:uncharacterized membrane protein
MNSSAKAGHRGRRRRRHGAEATRAHDDDGRRDAHAWYIHRAFPAACASVPVFVSSSAPVDPIATPRRSRALLAGVVAYLALALAAYVSGRDWIGALALFVLAGALLSPALRRRRLAAWVAWIVLGVLLGTLAMRGTVRLALDAVPVLVNAALGALFASTLGRGRVPLIARFVAIIEGPARAAQPRVAHYTRQLTWLWALLLGAQALLLAVLLGFAPDGIVPALGGASIAALGAAGWRLYLHAGSYALVPLVFVLEYAFRRWHLAEFPHPPLPTFVARVVQRWPALLHSLAADAARERAR